MATRSRHVWGVLAAIAIELVVALAAGMTGPLPSGVDGPRVRGAAAAGLYFDYLVTIVMENKDLCDVLTYCGGFSPYLTGLADTWGIADEDRYCNVNPSLPNYLCLTGHCGGRAPERPRFHDDRLELPVVHAERLQQHAQLQRVDRRHVHVHPRPENPGQHGVPDHPRGTVHHVR